MRVQVDGQIYDVPDDATPDEIDALTRKMAPKPPEVSKALAFGRGAVQGATLNFGDEIEGVIQALGRKYLPDEFGGGSEADRRKSLGDLFRESRNVSRRETKDAETAHPGYTMAGNIVGGLAPSVVAGGTWAAAPAYGVAEKLQKAARLGTMAAGLGGASALGASEAPDATGAAKDTLKGAALGLGFAAAAPVVTGALGRVARAVTNGVVKRSREAAYLAGKGAEDLTLGQQAPKSWVNSLEQSAESIPILGDVIKGHRQAGRESWQRAVLAEARPPGAPQLGPGKVSDKVSELFDGFHRAYDPIGKAPVQAVVPTKAGSVALKDAFANAAQDASVLADDATRKAVASFLDNAHSALVQKVGAGVPLKAADLIGIRSTLRQEIRNALSGQQPDYKTAKLLQNAEQAISDSLGAQLPAQAAAALKATDAQYAKLMRVADAVRRAGDQPGGFTPAQLSMSVKGGTERLGYAKGAGGELRQLARAGRETLDTTSPPTGHRLLTMGLGTAAFPVTTAGAALASTKFGQRLLTGENMVQRAVDPYVEALIKALRSGSQNPYVAGSVAEQGGGAIGR